LVSCRHPSAPRYIWHCGALILANGLPKGAIMPLNKKGSKIKAAMEKEYGKKKGEAVFYASENKGTIKGVTKKTGKKK
jgi:hypothetical protein